MLSSCRLRAGQAQRALHAVGIQLHRLGRGSRATERAVGRGGVPEPIMRRHHRHADAHRDLVPRDHRGDHLAPGQPVRLGQRQGGGDDDRADMQQRHLVRVVVVGGIDQDAIGERGEGGLRGHVRADDPGPAGCRWIQFGNALGDVRLCRVLDPGRHGAANGVQDDVAGHGDDRRWQVFEPQSGDEFGDGAGAHAGGLPGLSPDGIIRRSGARVHPRPGWTTAVTPGRDHAQSRVRCPPGLMAAAKGKDRETLSMLRLDSADEAQRPREARFPHPDSRPA